jgi:hypothetical protein
VSYGEVFGNKSSLYLILNCIVTISLGYILYCVSCNLYCGCFNLLRNVLVCVCVGFVMCVRFGKTYTSFYCVLYCLYCVFVLSHLCVFILICFICTSVRTTATE